MGIEATAFAQFHLALLCFCFFTRPDSVSEEMPVDNRETVQTFVFSVRPETLSGNPEKPETTSVTRSTAS